MAKYSKAHERDENSKMWRGFWHSTFGILLCWVPVVGLALGISGFSRQVVRITEQHRARMVMFMLYGLLSLTLSVGAIFGALYAYSRDTDVFMKTATRAWHALTGQDALPGQPVVNDYTGNPNPGLGVFSDGTDGIDSGEGDPLFGIDGAMLTSDQKGLLPDADLMSDVDALDFTDEDEGSLGLEDADSDGVLDLDAEDPLLADDYVELPFFYVVESDEVSAEGDLVRVDYKIVIDEYDPTDDELIQLFDDAIYEDGYDLHSISVYRDESELEGEYTVGRLVQAAVGEAPTVERKP